jgi:hypothetical protein
MSDKEVLGITYSRDLGWAGELTAFIGCPTMRSSVAITSNLDGSREIGFYHTSLSADEFRDAAACVRRSAYDDIPRLDRVVAPETKFLNIGQIYSAGELPMIRGFLLESLPDAIAKLQRELETGVIARIRQHPTHVVSATAAWNKSAFHVNEPLGIAVEFASVGSLPVTMANPVAIAAMTRPLILSVRPVGDDESIQSVAIEENHLRVPRGAPTSVELTLAADEKLEFAISKEVYLPPGTYEGHLAYRHFEERLNQPQFAFGELSMPLGIMTITA